MTNERRNGWVQIPRWLVILTLTLVFSLMATLWGISAAQVASIANQVHSMEIYQAREKERLINIEQILQEVRADIKEMRKGK